MDCWWEWEKERRFTPRAAARMESLPTDMGRSVDGFVGRDEQFSSGHVKSETSPGHLSDDMRK